MPGREPSGFPPGTGQRVRTRANASPNTPRPSPRPPAPPASPCASRPHRRTDVLTQPTTSHSAATAQTPVQPQWAKAGAATEEASAAPAKPETT